MTKLQAPVIPPSSDPLRPRTALFQHGATDIGQPCCVLRAAETHTHGVALQIQSPTSGTCTDTLARTQGISLSPPGLPGWISSVDFNPGRTQL